MLVPLLLAAWQVAGQGQALPASKPLHAFPDAAAEWPGLSESWKADCGTDRLTGASTRCSLEAPPYLPVGHELESGSAVGLSMVVTHCDGRVFGRSTNGLVKRYFVPSVTGESYSWPLRHGPMAELLRLQVGDVETNVRLRLATVGYLFTATNTAWAEQVFAFEDSAGDVYRLPFTEDDRAQVKAFMAGPLCEGTEWP